MLVANSLEPLLADKAELRNELSNLRTHSDISLYTLKKHLFLYGAFLTLVIISCTLYVVISLNTNARNFSDAPPLIVSSSDPADYPNEEIKKLRTTVNELNEKLKSQAGKVSHLDSVKPSLDCANLPADAQMQSVDYLIHFEVGSAKISPSSEETLNSIAKMISLVSNNCIVVEGHTDASGTQDNNLSLSKERAESVAQYVAAKSGIDTKYLVSIGKGSTKLLDGVDPRDPKNRRVVFKVVKQ